MTDRDFLLEFEEFLGRRGRDTTQGPWTFVERWEALVNRAVRGYQWGYYEFSNDLRIRDLLEIALNDPVLTKFEQMKSMGDRVLSADKHLKEVFAPDLRIGSGEQAWWHRGVLARAGEDYADDMKRLYGIHISGLPRSPT